MTKPTIAYYAAEYATSDGLPMYAGGLGVLAADYVMEAAAQGWQVVAFGAAYQGRLGAAGFKRLERDGQVFETVVDFGDWQVKCWAWEREFGTTRLVLIDADREDNSVLSRWLTSNLYDPDVSTRLLQEFVVAEASLAALNFLSVKPDRYHLNEGHMAFVPLALAARLRDEHGRMTLADAIEGVRSQVVGSKHTILAGAGDFADESMLERLFGKYLDRYGWSAHELLAAGPKASAPETFSTTAFMIGSAIRSSAVSQLHAKIEHEQHPESQLIPVTNGVHRPRWQESNLEGPADKLTDSELWRRHGDNRRTMVEYLNKQVGVNLNPDRLTVVWARRFAPYKRPMLLFSDVTRLQRLLTGDPGFQLVVSGNANPTDEEGTRILEQLVELAQNPDFAGRLLYLPHYSTSVSRRLVAGADVWLNTPTRGMEACGTSGMKAGLNGALQLSTRDGWLDEVELPAIGWEIPDAEPAEALYKTLEQEVLPAFYGRDEAGVPQDWMRRMRAVVKLTEEQFTAARMLEDYRTKLYQL
ncbi:MAG TPA: alpha-glucan family phosphorylase [Candidatus Saccharimonadia bacterium]|jgi:starch phosphorylase